MMRNYKTQMEAAKRGIITPEMRPEDFERMDTEKVASIIREVGLPFEQAETIVQKYKQ